MEVIWGREILKKKCLAKERANKGKYKDREPLEPSKRELIKSKIIIINKQQI